MAANIGILLLISWGLDPRLRVLPVQIGLSPCIDHLDIFALLFDVLLLIA
jgi:hypothetical protein